jgi:CBS domain-containing protein
MAKSIKDAMTTKPASLPSTSTLVEAARLMRDLDIGDVLIEQDGRLAGIVTDRDLVVRAMAEGRDSTSKLGDIVSSDVVSITATDGVEDVIRLMRDHALRRVPVVDNGKASESCRSVISPENASLTRCWARSATRPRTTSTRAP